MGAVYRVFDPVTQKSLALKRSLGNDRRFLGMFEREYHTLRGLKHPSIIEVYDYGVDEQGAYYTMELLQGRDLGELAPLDYRSVCRYLRDVASSLGLLHARRMLHRDLSPRNVRVSDSGRCKLLDFGVLSGFGVPELVVGTPPFIPPESLHRLALDQRADLFALGAVAYSLLTGSHAYPARSLAVLSDVWRRTPPRPSELVAKLGKPELPPIPVELDELVMSLLTLDPLGRPGSVAEVIDRLNRIGDLPADAEAVAVARSYLVGVQTVGREDTDKYGIVASTLEEPRISRVHGIVEKPKPDKAPSTLAVVGRYVLTPGIYRKLESTPRGAGGEIQLTDGIAALLADEAVYAYAFEGKRYDCGSKLGYLEATVEFGLKHTDLGDKFSDYLTQLVASRMRR